jgi:hypothetical protein
MRSKAEDCSRDRVMRCTTGKGDVACSVGLRAANTTPVLNEGDSKWTHGKLSLPVVSGHQGQSVGSVPLSRRSRVGTTTPAHTHSKNSDGVYPCPTGGHYT